MESDDHLWHLIPNWPLRSNFACILEQLLKDLVSWGSTGECSMIDHFLRDASVVLSCPFRSTVLQSGARLSIHTLNSTGPCSQWCPVPNWGVFEWDIAHRRSVAVLCMLYKIRCNPIHPLNDALPGPHVPVRVTSGALVSHRHTYAPARCRTAGLLFPSQWFSGTILLTTYSMVWDWRVSRAGPMLFYWPKLLYPYYSLLLFFPFPPSCL